MTAPLGARTCPVLGCARRIHVTPDGTVYARCIAHTLALLGGAFGDPRQGARAGVYPRALGSRPLPVAVPAHRPAA